MQRQIPLLGLIVASLLALPVWAADRKTDLALLDAAEQGDVASVEALLQQGASVATRNSQGNTALGYASRGGHLEVAKLLVAKGADVNQGNLKNIPPLHE